MEILKQLGDGLAEIDIVRDSLGRTTALAVARKGGRNVVRSRGCERPGKCALRRGADTKVAGEE